MLWLTLVVAAFFGGMALQRHLDKPLRIDTFSDPEGGEHQVMVTRDRAMWFRMSSDFEEEEEGERRDDDNPADILLRDIDERSQEGDGAPPPPSDE